jgi:hypothetical protein
MVRVHPCCEDDAKPIPLIMVASQTSFGCGMLLPDGAGQQNNELGVLSKNAID